MSRVSPPTGEAVEATKRRAMTAKRRLSIWLEHDGQCGLCRLPVDLVGCEIEHRIPVWLGGADDDGGNTYPAHPACHKAKTARDKAEIAKVKRLLGETGANRRKVAIRSRGFAKPTVKATWPKRAFPRKAT